MRKKIKFKQGVNIEVFKGAEIKPDHSFFGFWPAFVRSELNPTNSSGLDFQKYVPLLHNLSGQAPKAVITISGGLTHFPTCSEYTSVQGCILSHNNR